MIIHTWQHPDYGRGTWTGGASTPPGVTVYALNENKRPIGFAAWSTTDEKPSRKPRKRTSAPKETK